MKKALPTAILFLIISLAFFLRFFKVSEVPPSLNWDETSIAYNAYSILKTGRDEWGVKFPLNFKSYGEYKLPGQIYASIPAIAIFDLNELGVRITPVIYGTLTVLLLYFLVSEMFCHYSLFIKHCSTIAILAAFFLAVSPWHIQLTRASLESSFALFWIIMGVWFLLKGLRQPRWLTVSMIPFALSIYTYNSARGFIPLFLFAIFLIFSKYFWKVKAWFLVAGLFFAILMVPLGYQVISGQASARYRLISITDEAGLIPRIEERRNNSNLSPVITKLLHNRYTYISFYFAKNYLSHFTPDFLFIKGAGHRQHHVQGVGELYWLQAPFIILGAYYLIKKKDKSLKVLLPWLFLALIPVSLTNDSIPNALRTLNVVPIYQILTALGIFYTFERVKKKKVFYGIVCFSFILFLINFGIYIKNLYVNYPINYSRDWQYGYKEAVGYVKDHYNDYDLIVFSRAYGEPHMFTLFFLSWDPAKYQNDPNLLRFEANDWVWVLKFDKFYFPDLGDEETRYQNVIGENPGKKILFIGKPQDFPDSISRLYTIDFLNGSRAFDIVEYK